MLKPDEEPSAEAEKHPYLYDLLKEPAEWVLRLNLPNDQLSSLTENDVKQLRATYYGMIAEIDNHIGRILDTLERQGILEETLIVFTSDHGELLGDHWHFSKYSYYEQSFNVPLIIRSPETKILSPEKRWCTELTEQVDIMPTILEWIDAPIPVQCDGRSLLGIINGKEVEDWRSHSLSEADFRGKFNDPEALTGNLTSKQCSFAVIRSSTHKLVYFPTLPSVLFDTENDPWEQNNLASDSNYAGHLNSCIEELLKLRMTSERPPAQKKGS